jgi:ABC-type amino acid transport substrate-binding protein
VQKIQKDWIARVLLGLVLMSSLTLPVNATEPLVIVYFPDSIRSKIGALIIVEVYKRAKLSAVAIPLPGLRSTNVTVTNDVAGEMRVKSYVKVHPEVTLVEPAVTTWTTVAFYKPERAVQIESLVDLKAYTIGYVRGTRAVESLIEREQLGQAEIANTPDTLFRMLQADRFEVALEDRANGNFMLQKYGYQHIAQFEIEDLPVYLILSPKYKDLAPVLSKTIRAMIASGEMKGVADRIEREVLLQGPN